MRLIGVGKENLKMAKLRIACIGAGPNTGSRTRSFMDVITKLTDMYDLCAVADPNEEAGAGAAAEYDIAGVYTDVEEMLKAEKPDVALRMAPTDAAMSCCVRAAELGCHVISEIPIALTLPMADRIISACRDNGVKLEIAENVWLWPEEQLKQKIVQAGLIGEPTHARLKYPCGSYHGFNAIRMILGKEPTRVLGYGGEVPVMPLPAYGGGMMTSVQWDGGVLEFPGGVKCLFEMPPKKPVWERNWDIVGTHGYLSGDSLYLYAEGHYHGSGVEDHYAIEQVHKDVDGSQVLEAVRVNTDPPVVWQNPYARYGISETDNIAKAAILESIYRAVVEDTEPMYGADNARRDMELCIALKESAWRGSEWVDLPLREVTSVEERLHEEFERRYGCDPLDDIDAQLKIPFTRASAMWTVAGWL